VKSSGKSWYKEIDIFSKWAIFCFCEFDYLPCFLASDILCALITTSFCQCLREILGTCDCNTFDVAFAIFLQNVTPQRWEQSGGRSVWGGWSVKGERWGQDPSRLPHILKGGALSLHQACEFQERFTPANENLWLRIPLGLPFFSLVFFIIISNSKNSNSNIVMVLSRRDCHKKIVDSPNEWFLVLSN